MPRSIAGLPGAAGGGQRRHNRDMTSDVPAADVPATGLWHNRNWRLFFTGQVLSMVGDVVFDVTVVLWVATVIAKGQTWAPLAVGGALIAAAAPVMLIGPFAGVFVDRWDRRRTMMATDVIRAVAIAALLAVPALGDRLSVTAQLVGLYGVVAFASAAAQFFNGARFGVLARIVAPSDQTRAGGLSQAMFALASIVGPPLAAPLLFSVGVHWALIVNSLSFVASYLATLAIRITPDSFAHDGGEAKAQRSFRSELAEGARFFLGNKVLRILMICVIVATFGVAAINVLDVFFVTENLHARASALGTLGAAFGLGSVIGAVIATAIGSRIDALTLFWVMATATGIAILGYARSTSLPVAFAVLLVAGIPLAIVNSVAGPILLKVTPQRLLGRIMALINPIQQVAGIAGMALVAYLASTTLRGLNVSIAGVHFGRIDSIFFAGGLLVCASGLWAGLALRGVDRTAMAADAQAAPQAAEADATASATTETP
jgi:MFS family permease